MLGPGEGELYTLFQKKCNFNRSIFPGAPWSQSLTYGLDDFVKWSWEWHAVGIEASVPTAWSAGHQVALVRQITSKWELLEVAYSYYFQSGWNLPDSSDMSILKNVQRRDLISLDKMSRERKLRTMSGEWIFSKQMDTPRGFYSKMSGENSKCPAKDWSCAGQNVRRGLNEFRVLCYFTCKDG